MIPVRHPPGLVAGLVEEETATEATNSTTAPTAYLLVPGVPNLPPYPENSRIRKCCALNTRPSHCAMQETGYVSIGKEPGF